MNKSAVKVAQIMFGVSERAQTLGLTSAISTKDPTAEEIKDTADLKTFLEANNAFESEVALKNREKIIDTLSSLFKQWIKNVSIARNTPNHIADKMGGKVCPFGSYRLGVHDKGADIDVLCVAPMDISRKDFFHTFFGILQRQPEVTECVVSSISHYTIFSYNKLFIC